MRKQRTLETLRARGENALRAGHTLWWAGLGALAEIRARGRETFDDLVEKGKKVEKDERTAVGRTARHAAKRAGEARRTVERKVQEASGALLHRLGIPTHDEVRTLLHRVDQLSNKIQHLRAGR